MRWISLYAEYGTQVVGSMERDTAEERIARGDDADAIKACVDLFLAGRLKPLRVIRAGDLDVGKLEITEHPAEKKPGEQRDTWTRRPVKLAAKHVLAAKLHTRGRDLREEDDEGEPVEPFIGLVFTNGARVDIPFKPPKPKEPAKDPAKSKESDR